MSEDPNHPSANLPTHGLNNHSYTGPLEVKDYEQIFWPPLKLHLSTHWERFRRFFYDEAPEGTRTRSYHGLVMHNWNKCSSLMVLYPFHFVVRFFLWLGWRWTHHRLKDSFADRIIAEAQRKLEWQYLERLKEMQSKMEVDRVHAFLRSREDVSRYNQRLDEIEYRCRQLIRVLGLIQVSVPIEVDHFKTVLDSVSSIQNSVTKLRVRIAGNEELENRLPELDDELVVLRRQNVLDLMREIGESRTLVFVHEAECILVPSDSWDKLKRMLKVG